MRVLVLYAHPAQQHSRINSAMAEVAMETPDVTFVDLYGTYPRFDLNVDVEKQRLLDHDAFVFQFPLMWYSTPPILKEWQDLILEHGFAYGEGGDALHGKLWFNAVTAGAPETAYSEGGHNKFELRTFLSPLEATANLCGMRYAAPYTLFSALGTPDIDGHAAGYRALLEGLRDDRLDLDALCAAKLTFADTISKFTTGGAA